MRYWLGAVLFVLAAAFLVSALRHRRRVFAIASREALDARRTAAMENPRSISAMGETGRPIVLFFVGWVGLKTGLAYLMLDGGRYVSWFDMAGFYALLGAYATSFSIESTYRMSDAIAIRDAAAAGGESREPEPLVHDVAERRAA